MSRGATSSSSTELVAGFRIVRPLADGVWEAVQPELGRRVALRRLPPGTAFNASQWPERPGVVGLFAVVPAPEGTYIATRFVPGARTLAQCRSASPALRGRWLDEVAAALEGSVHGSLTDCDILVDGAGRALLTGFGRAPAGATAADDEAALARLRAAPRRRSRRLPVVVATVVAAAAVTVVLARDGDGPEPVPPPPAGSASFGSALAPGGVRTVDCEGHVPSGSSVPCTLMQSALPGRGLVAPYRALVRRFTVRGARGPLRLTILCPAPTGFRVCNRARPVTVAAGDAVASFRLDRSVPEGARFGLEVGPGAGVGIRAGVRGAVTARFAGVRFLPQRPSAGGGGGQELLLRVDLVRDRG